MPAAAQAAARWQRSFFISTALTTAEVAGTVLARSHARTGLESAIAAYCGTSGRLDRAIARFAVAYADQTAADHARFVAELAPAGH